MKQLVRGDVVVARSPTNPVQLVCKRIVGTEGDCIVTSLSSVFGCSKCVVPPGHVWLAGDNSANSTDSRMYGPVPASLIQGRVFFKVWPPRDFGYVLNSFGQVEDRQIQNQLRDSDSEVIYSIEENIVAYESDPAL
eukprot:TRINITY_DN20381_c0_g1_i16.p1 TRINITY_DN20381_c0_g1~~TRINITY_DN20381_c0_g1_i16.p1  ORF type:complete len:136 (+),score=11.91 TRINITY_DN20381_c0_g1_i16:149-556(+)